MENLIRLLESLNPEILRRRSDFVVCGSGPMAVRGMRDVHDLDLLVSMNLWDRFEAGEFAAPTDAHGGFVRSDKYDRVLYKAFSHGQAIDVFATTPRMDQTHVAMIDQGVERYQIPGVGLVAFQPLRGVLAIKALCPSKPKHIADMISLSQRIAIEETPTEVKPLPPFEKFSPSDPESMRALAAALGIESEAADVAERLDTIAAKGVPQEAGAVSDVLWTDKNGNEIP